DRGTRARRRPFPHGGRELDEQYLLGPRLRARPGRHGAAELAVLRNGVARRRLASRVPLPQRALPPPRVPDELLPILGGGGLDRLRARDLPPRPGVPAPRLLKPPEAPHGLCGSSQG